MKPATTRATRRNAGKSSALSIADLAQRVARARVPNIDKALQERGKRILASYLQTAQTYGLAPRDVASEMASGQAAWRLGTAVRDEILRTPPDAVRKAACADGCAFCCILSGGEGGLITAFEAKRLHAALTPLKGQADGRDWHPDACPALDPQTRSCRAYDARPMICRSFLSTDADACRSNADGGAEQGAGLLGSHLDYLVIHALCRAALRGITMVQSYSMAQTAAQGIAGTDHDSALAAAKHKPGALQTACHDAAKAARS